MARGMEENRMESNTGTNTLDLWRELHELLQCRQAETERIKVPSHAEIYGNAKADNVAD